MTTTTTRQATVHARDLRLSFGPTVALCGATLQIEPGEVVALMGPSGSGKSTLLHCLAGILEPDSGAVSIAGQLLADMSERERSALRLRTMGFVFQYGDMVPELTLAENVALPLQLTGTRYKDADRAARDMLRRLGLTDEEAGRRAGAVSGGQAQRAAVARALIARPQVLFADEPTGSLDTVTGERVLDLLIGSAREFGSAVLLVTHDNRVAAHADRLATMRDGIVVGPGQ
jgi:putative ABC transport system ATP-binding protein